MPKDLLQALRETNGDEEDTADYAVTLQVEQPNSFMVEFFEEVDEINTMIDFLRAYSEQVKTKYSEILSDPNQDEKKKEQLEELMQNIKRLAEDIRSKLKGVELNIGKFQAINTSGADLRIRKMQFATMSKKFITVMTDHNTCQLDYRERCKARIQRQLEIADREISNDELEEMLESGNPAIFTQGIMTDTLQAKQTLQDIEARHADIIKLEKSIKDLRDLFIDIALLVEGQGEMIDRIEFNVTSAEDYVKTAVQDTKKAVNYQSKARRKLIIILICVGVLLVILAIILAIVLSP